VSSSLFRISMASFLLSTFANFILSIFMRSSGFECI
jgi:hypothetical protein